MELKQNARLLETVSPFTHRKYWGIVRAYDIHCLHTLNEGDW